jgi:hypothetical protein
MPAQRQTTPHSYNPTGPSSAQTWGKCAPAPAPATDSNANASPSTLDIGHGTQQSSSIISGSPATLSDHRGLGCFQKDSNPYDKKFVSSHSGPSFGPAPTAHPPTSHVPRPDRISRAQATQFNAQHIPTADARSGETQIKFQQSPISTATHSRAHSANAATSVYQNRDGEASTGQLSETSKELSQSTSGAPCPQTSSPRNPGPWGADLEEFEKLRKRNEPVNTYSPVNSSPEGFSLGNPGRWGKDLEYFDKHMRATGHHTTDSSLSSTWDPMDSDD